MRTTTLTLIALIFSLQLFCQANSKDSLRQVELQPLFWQIDDFAEPRVDLYAYTHIIQDIEESASFTEVFDKKKSAHSNDTKESFDPFRTYWIKINLKGHPQKVDTYLFDFSQKYGQRNWKYINAFLIHEDGQIVEQRTGINLKNTEKQIVSPINLLEFEIGKNEKVELLVRLEGVEENRVPNFIGAYLVKKDLYPDLEGAYQYRGSYAFENPISHFKANFLTHHEIYVDASKENDIEFVSNNWQRLSRKNLFDTPSQPNTVYWLKATLIGSSIFNGKHLFHISSSVGNDNYSFDYIDAYLLDKDGNYNHQRIGDHISTQDRPYKFWANFIQIDISPNDTLDLFVRLEGADRRFLMPFIGLFHINQSSIWPSQNFESRKNGLFYGILCVQFLYFLLLFIIEKELLHLYFATLVAGIFLCFGFVEDNYTSFVILPSWRDYHIPLFFVGLYLIILGFIKFTEKYFSYSRSKLLSKKIIPSYLFLFTLVILYAIYQYEYINGTVPSTAFYYQLALLFPILGIGLCMTMIFTAKKKKNIPRKFFLLAFLFPSMAFMVILFYAVMGHAVEDNTISNQLWIPIFYYDVIKLAIILMLILLALSTGYRTNQLKAEKENALQKNLTDQKQINKAISRFVPNEFLSALNKTSITEVALGDNIEKEVTVFFSDIRDYTSLSEQMTPEENFRFVNAYNSRMGPIIQMHHGFVNQYLGDGIMAIFPQSPADALRAAIQMQQTIQKYNQLRKRKGQLPIMVGMGMHTGSLIMGITGDKNRLDATTISDSVNSASRIENLSDHYGASILLSEVCLNQLENPEEFNFRYLGQVQVKGKQKLLRIYECFNGDLPDTFKLKKATISRFNTGIEHYFQQHFSQAVQHFEFVVQQNPNDKTAKLFLHKAKQLEESGVLENWTGVEMMDRK